LKSNIKSINISNIFKLTYDNDLQSVIENGGLELAIRTLCYIVYL